MRCLLNYKRKQYSAVAKQPTRFRRGKSCRKRHIPSQYLSFILWFVKDLTNDTDKPFPFSFYERTFNELQNLAIGIGLGIYKVAFANSYSWYKGERTATPDSVEICLTAKTCGDFCRVCARQVQNPTYARKNDGLIEQTGYKESVC